MATRTPRIPNQPPTMTPEQRAVAREQLATSTRRAELRRAIRAKLSEALPLVEELDGLTLRDREQWLNMMLEMTHPRWWGFDENGTELGRLRAAIEPYATEAPDDRLLSGELAFDNAAVGRAALNGVPLAATAGIVGVAVELPGDDLAPFANPAIAGQVTNVDPASIGRARRRRFKRTE